MPIYGTKFDETIDAADGVTNGKDIIFGLDGKDTIYGLGGDDVMKGGGGADTFHGGPGIDEVNYSDSAEGVIVDLDTGETWGGTAQDDVYDSIENVTGSLYEDDLWGTGGDNTLRGGGGDDHLYGIGGADVLYGGTGMDYLYGGPQADVLHGDENNDGLDGGAGADQLFGGDGIDTASYNGTSEGVVVSLKHGVALKGEAEGDTFDSIENLIGSFSDDHLYGDDNPNEIRGSFGNDVLKGFGGADVLNGGDNDDTLIGGDGLDVLTGGKHADAFVWAATGETGLTGATADRITDFNSGAGDRIDLSDVDANVYAAGDQAFTFIGTAAFSGNPGEIRYYQDGGNTYIEMQTGTSLDIEGVIRLDGLVTPQASWFVL